jgi:phosphatidylserine decarboxylase
MDPIVYINRLTGQKEIEKVYGGKALQFLYGDDLLSRLIGWPLVHLLVRTSLFSFLYGYWQKRASSRSKIRPFIANFAVDPSEFLDSVDSYRSFNDFFIRHLKPTVRPIAPGKDVAVIPADGRYYFYQDLTQADGFIVKGRKFCLETLLGDRALAARYVGGSMLLARLCPVDYHRFHFPCDGVAAPARLINGWLYSVNPLAVKRNIVIFTENKRAVTELVSEPFGRIQYLEIGATNVGSIIQTYIPNTLQGKGAEKGYFSFGGSALVLLFEPGRIQFDQDLLEATAQGLEIRCLMGQSLGKAKIHRPSCHPASEDAQGENYR